MNIQTTNPKNANQFMKIKNKKSKLTWTTALKETSNNNNHYEP